MAVMTPSGTTGYNIQKWGKKIWGATYQRMVAIPIFDEGDKPYHQLNTRRNVRVAATPLSGSDDGSSLNASTLADSQVNLTPSGQYIMVAWSDNLDAEIDFSLNSEAQGELEQAMAEASDESVLDQVASLTQILSQAQVDVTMWRQAYARLTGNTNGVPQPGGGGPTVWAIFSHTQLPGLQNIPEFNAADLRGDSENPYVMGLFMKGSGVNLRISTVVEADANGWHNFMGLSECIQVAWNRHTTVEYQKYNLQNKVIAYNNLGSTVLHDLRGLDLRTTASGIS